MNFWAALESLRESWQRSVLSMVGVVVGAMAVLLLMSIAIGVEEDIGGQVEDLGVNVLVVLPGRVETGMVNNNLAGQSYLREEDATRLREVEGVRKVAILSFAGGGVRHQEQEIYPFVIASTHEWFDMHGVELAHGRFFRPDEPGAAVIGAVAAQELFEEESDAIGQVVEINQNEYEVVGVMLDEGEESTDLFASSGFQNVVYIPFVPFKEDGEAIQISRLMVQSEADAEPEALVARLEASLGERLDRQQYSVLTQEDLLDLVFEVMSILGWLVIGLTSISLFVGGVGVMAIMLMAVNERRREIGIRKATGAKRSDIFVQFLYESLAIGLGGVGVALVLSGIVAAGLRAWTPISPKLTLGTVGLALAVGVGVGVVFGLIPALRAAKQDPVVSLRNE